MRGRPLLVAVSASFAVMGSMAVGMLIADSPVGAGTAGLRSLASPTQQELVDRGHTLFESSCASCHGANGAGRTTANAAKGEAVGPSLESAGEASAFYQLSTGRMPLADATGPAVRKPPVFDDADTAALVAYVASLGDGPRLPALAQPSADLAGGGEMFRANCAPCHSAAGAGGALSYGAAAPGLHQADALEVGAAIRSGPGQMPRFGPSTLTDSQINDIARYVEYLRDPSDRGGLPLGRTGPVPEGFVAWVLGIGALVGAVFWIGTRSPWNRTDEEVTA